MNIGIPELIVILIVALLVIGPKKLPDLAKSIGKGIGEFKRAMDNVKEDLNVDEVRKDIYNVKDAFSLEKTVTGEEKQNASSTEKAAVKEKEG